jgi:hypothetical protein
VAFFCLPACQRDNGVYCDTTRPCAVGTCDLQANVCTGAATPDLSAPDGGGGGNPDMMEADLLLVCTQCSGATPICNAPNCVGCDTVADGETACATIDATRPHCLTSGAGQGACAGCRDGNDCPVPSARICDSTTHACRGCIADSECPSLVCDLTRTSASKGQCVDASLVVYVDVTNCNDANGDTPAMPACSITNAAKKTNKTVVRLAGTLYTQDTTINNIGPITIVGDTGATMRPASMNKPALMVTGTSDVTVRNVVFTSQLGNGAGVICGGGSLKLDRCTVKTNDGYGIDANNCGTLAVDASVVMTNLQGGLRVGGNFNITNNFVIKNGGSAGGSAGGMVINSPSTTVTQIVANNTFADNTGSGVNAGVSCAVGSNTTLLNNILYKNLFGATSSETNCTTLYCATDDAVDAARANAHNVDLSTKTPGFVSVTDYHLAAGSPCKDVGSTSGAPDHDIDEQPRPDPATAKVDIGADELQ